MSAAADTLGVLHRHVAVRLLNVSGSGCLIESGVPVKTGTVGTLRLVLGGVEYGDLVMVARCEPIKGHGARFHVGVQFLWEDTPGSRALRRLGTQLVGQARSVG